MESKRNLSRLKSAVDRARPQSSQTTAPDITRSEEQLSSRPGLPPWDRTVDIVYHKYKHGESRPSRAVAFEALLNKLISAHGRTKSETTTTLRLPDKIRFQIFQNLVESHGRATKPISLNRPVFNKDCWESSDLLSLRDALGPLQPYLTVSFGFYTDLLLAFLSEYTFHATFSPFVGPRINPLATTWLNKYAPYMRSVIIEIDFTRLAHGPNPGATQLLPGLGNLDTLLFNFSMSQLTRDKSAPLENLILLCRRFYGRRGDPEAFDSRSSSQTGKSSRASTRSAQSQASDSVSTTTESLSNMSLSETASDETRVSSPDQSADPDPNPNPPESPSLSPDSTNMSLDSGTSSSGQGDPKSPSSDGSQSFHSTHSSEPEQPPPFYCPDEHLIICNHIARLRDMVDSLRMCGFSDKYTHQIVATLFPGVREQPVQHHSYRVAPSAFWPRLRGQKSWINLGQDCIVLDDHDTAPVSSVFPEGPIQLPPPIVSRSGATSLPGRRGVIQRSRNNTVSSVASVPSRRSTQSNDSGQSNALTSVQSDDQTRAQRMLGKYRKGRSRRRN